MNRNKLYIALSIACFAGYIWLLILFFTGSFKGIEPEVCIIKNITNIPCPSCGTSRAVVLLINGDIRGALGMNPLGFIIALIMVICPPWIIYDLIRKQNTLFRFYLKTETLLNHRIIAIPAIILVLLNWLWNIQKGL